MIIKHCGYYAGSTAGWCRYNGFARGVLLANRKCKGANHTVFVSGGRFLGMNGFGDSAPAGVLLKHFGFVPERVVELVKESIADAKN